MSTIFDPEKVADVEFGPGQLVCKLRQSERDLYELQGGPGGRAVQSDRRARLEREAVELKDRLGSAAEDLDMRIRCYRETQV